MRYSNDFHDPYSPYSYGDQNRGGRGGYNDPYSPFSPATNDYRQAQRPANNRRDANAWGW